MHLGRYEAALGAFDSAAAAQPGNYIACYRRGMAQRRLKNYEQAIDDFTRSCEMADEGRAAWVVYHRGALHWMAGHREAAVADYRRALEALGYATYGTAREVLILRELGRYAEADSVLARARRGILQDDRLASVLSCLAGEVTPSELAAAADVADPRRSCEAYYYAAEVNLGAGRLAEARELFGRCLDTGIQSDPDNPIEPMTEYELAEWRLAQLAES
jgi:tetratricopeptide (TPR) repeat protein